MIRRLILGTSLALAVCGCSQVAVLAPVASRVTSVRAAAVDVLLDQQVQILTAPVCVTAQDDITCTGATVGSEAIAVTSTHADSARMTVTVGSRTVYDGSVQDVLDAHARQSP